jgi:hypothetical protein
MRKPLAGKRYFEALGRRAQSKDLRRSVGDWPFWAISAYLTGNSLQKPWRKDLHYGEKK